MADRKPEVAALLEELRSSARPALLVRPEPAGAPASVALLAGSFDPITIGHAAMAEAAAGLAELVVLVYAVRTLPKEGRAAPVLLGEEERIAALERFCEARSYAVGLASHGLLAEQVLAAAARFPEAALVVAVGSDKLLQLLDPRWYEDIGPVLSPMFERATVAFAMRSGDDEAVAEALARPEHTRWVGRITRLDVPSAAAAVSSRRVRELLARGDDVAPLVPAEVRPFLGRPLSP